MATQTQDNQEIEQAIERLSQKMRTVSDAMALARTPVKKTAANQNKAKGGKTRRVSLGKFFKYILILSLFAGLSYMLASLVSVYMEKMKNGQSQTGDQPVATAPLPASLHLKMHRKTCQLIQHRPLKPPLPPSLPIPI